MLNGINKVIINVKDNIKKTVKKTVKKGKDKESSIIKLNKTILKLIKKS